MNNIKKYWPAVIIAIVVIFVGAIIIAKRQPTLILFYGDTCPHCQNVEEYIVANNIRAKLSFQELEVYNNQTNAQLLAAKAKRCGLDTSAGVGVPFFFDGQNCLVGDQPIIDYFKTK
jgi:hypothetical protein